MIILCPDARCNCLLCSASTPAIMFPLSNMALKHTPGSSLTAWQTDLVRQNSCSWHEGKISFFASLLLKNWQFSVVRASSDLLWWSGYAWLPHLIMQPQQYLIKPCSDVHDWSLSPLKLMSILKATLCYRWWSTWLQHSWDPSLSRAGWFPVPAGGGARSR